MNHKLKAAIKNNKSTDKTLDNVFDMNDDGKISKTEIQKEYKIGKVHDQNAGIVFKSGPTFFSVY